jgi:DnaJ-class molecular chaperone
MTTTTPRDFYAVLEVSRQATAEEIRSCFRKLARERHPDRFQGPAKARAEEDFQLLTEAANVLLNPEKRRGHDVEIYQPEVHRRQEEAALAKMLMQRGRIAYKSGNHFEAVEAFDRAVREDPKNAFAWYFLARACSHNRRWLSRGVAAIETAVKLEPTNADYLQLGGAICAKANMTAKAEKYYQKALSWGADEAEIQEALSRLDFDTTKRGEFS